MGGKIQFMANIEEEGLQRPVAQSKYIWAYECCTKTRKNLNFSFNPTHTHTHTFVFSTCMINRVTL